MINRNSPSTQTNIKMMTEKKKEKENLILILSYFETGDKYFPFYLIVRFVWFDLFIYGEKKDDKKKSILIFILLLLLFGKKNPILFYFSFFCWLMLLF